MSKTLNGLLSGKYDSTKQRVVLLNGDRLRNYRSYTATMRMELLLTGWLIFTDAQFFDGLYFHWLGKNPDELQAFEKLLAPFSDAREGKTSLYSISIKCRGPELDEQHGYQDEPNPDQVAVKTFCKEFQFSSIEDDKLAEAIFELGRDYMEEYVADDGEKKKICSQDKNLDAYISAMEKKLKSLYGEQSSIVGNWTRYADELRTLFGIKRVDKWGYCDSDGKWNIPKWGILMNECFEQDFPGELEQTYLEVMKGLMERAKGSEGMDDNPAARRYFARIKGELNTGVSNRSKIITALDALDHLNNEVTPMDEDKAQREHREYVNDCFRDFRQLLNDRYNKVLACQHGCRFLDLCDYTKTFDLISQKNAAIQLVNLPSELIASLAELSWVDFWKLLNEYKCYLETAFYKWMSAYDSFSSSDMQSLVDELEQYFVALVSVFASADSGRDIAPTITGPWNIEDTCNDDIRAIFAQSYSFPYYLVGGGSFEPGTREMRAEDENGAEGNEICILCIEEGAAEQEKIGVLRLRLKATSADREALSKDHNFNTLLAPVCNLLNGGNL